MTLFISFLLIYNFHMDWWWYGIAIAIWGAHFAFTRRKRFGLSIAEQVRARQRESPDADKEKNLTIPSSVPDDPGKKRE